MTKHNARTTDGQQTGQKANAGRIEIVLLAKKRGRFSKSIGLSDNELELVVKAAPDSLTDMTAQRLVLDHKDPLNTLRKAIDKFKPNEALCLGRMPADAPDTALEVVLSGAAASAKGDRHKDWMTRTTADTAYAKGTPAPVLLDFDLKDYPKHITRKVLELARCDPDKDRLADTPDALVKALKAAVPELAEVQMIYRPSTSSGIRVKGTQTAFPAGGLHIYMMIGDGSRSDEFLKALQDRLWEAGLGFARINKGGVCQKWSIIDPTVGRSERPCYEAPPELDAKLKQLGRTTQTVKGKVAAFDPDALHLADAAAVAALYQAELATPEIIDLIDRRTQEKENELVAGGMSRQRAQATVAALRDVQKAPLSLDLYPTDTRQGPLRVLDLLLDPEKWDGINMADPMEGPGYHTNIAVFYANRGSSERAKVHSFAHGGIVYDLTDYGVQDAVEAVQDGLPLDRVVKALRMPLEVAESVLDALAASGVDVDPKEAEKALGWGRARSISRTARASLDFGDGEHGSVALSDELRTGLESVARLERPPAGTKGTEVGDWLDKAKAKLKSQLETRSAAKSAQPILKNAIGPLGVQQAGDFMEDAGLRRSVIKPLGWYRQTVNTITANPNCGKTAFAIETAIALAMGEALYGRKLDAARALYFAGENYSDVRSRLVLSFMERGIDPYKIPFDIRRGGFSFADHCDDVLAQTSLREYELIFVDTLAAHFSGESENDNAQMQKYFDSFAKVCNGPGQPAVVVLAHPSAAYSDVAPSYALHNMRPRGASSSWGTIDSNLNLVKRGSVVQGHLQKRRSKPVPDVFFRLKPMSDPTVVDGDGEIEESVRAEPISAGQAQFSKINDSVLVLKELEKDPNQSLRKIEKALQGEGHKITRSKISRAIDKLAADKLIVVTKGDPGCSDEKKVTQAGHDMLQECE